MDSSLRDGRQPSPHRFLDDHDRDAETFMVREGHPFDEPGLSFARGHPGNTGVVGAEQNQRASSDNAAWRSASCAASISPSMSLVSPLSSEMPMTLRQS